MTRPLLAPRSTATQLTVVMLEPNHGGTPASRPSRSGQRAREAGRKNPGRQAPRAASWLELRASLLAISARRHADNLAERVREIVAVVEPGGKCNISDGIVGCAKSPHGMGEAQLDQIAVGRRRRRRLEHAAEGARRITKAMRDLVEVKRFAAARAQVLQDLREPCGGRKVLAVRCEAIAPEGHDELR